MVTAQLRLMCTTDLHAHLLPYDYFADRGDRPYGLARTATLIRTARAEVTNTLLFDNGDALQGTPMADITAQPDSGWRGAHPVIHAMNQLGYDAATLGNHEFNFGLDWLARALADATFPFTCANIHGYGQVGALLPPSLLLRRRIADIDGALHPLTLGVIGLVPAQIMIWDRLHLNGRLTSRDMVETARDIVPKLRAAGADLVVLLAHTGIDPAPAYPMMENAALPLASLPGVDAIMTGHSHDVFPLPGRNGPPGVDHAGGTINDTPALMAGSCGSHLGVLDLMLERRGARWRIVQHRSQLRAVAAHTPADPALAVGLDPAHRATLKLTGRPVGRASARLHSYLALARPDASVAAINAVQRRCLARAVAGTADAALPILSAACAFKTGGHGGPDNFTDLPAGPLRLRHAADLYLFPNQMAGIRVSGAELREWLERAAICFAQIAPGAQDAPLQDPHVPGHDFDVIDGLSYQIDLSQPARYDRCGTRIRPEARRIRDLRYGGAPLSETARFLLATNSYRSNGGGPFAPVPEDRVVHRSSWVIRDLLTEDMRSAPLAAPPGYRETWRFAPMPGTTVVLETGPAVMSDPDAVARIGAEPLNITDAGFLRLRLPL